MKKQVFVSGQRIRLKANKDEGWSEEYGTYEGISGNDAHIVIVEHKYRDGKNDDGLREVMTEQIEKLL